MNVAQLMNALAYGALLTMLSSGLALIYGLRDVMNFAHGAFYMLGAFVSTTIVEHSNFWVAIVVVPILFLGVGALFELLVLRPLRTRPIIAVALVTVGLGFVVTAIARDIFGTQQRTVASPKGLDGTFSLFGSAYPTYRIFLIVIGLGSVAALALWLRFTRTGLHVRAVSTRPQTARMVGVNTSRLGLLVVSLSTAFAGLAGVLAGPYLAVDTGMGDSILVICLVIVVLGGVGSIGGAIVAALVVGFVQVIGNLELPSIAGILPYALLVAVLVWRPQGLGRGRAAH